jgi:REP element-mobilizing transposase RayT
LSTIFNRRSIRLSGYDYATAGVYFVTICTHKRALRLASICGSQIQLTAEGALVKQTWFELPLRFNTVELDEFIVMPNHIHGIIVLNKPDGASPAPTNSLHNFRPALSSIVCAFKSLAVACLNRQFETRAPLWQRNYYEHVIRSGKSLDDIRRYIHDNPLRWSFDRENPDHKPCPSSAARPSARGWRLSS